MTAARITLDAAALEELRGRTFLPGPVTTDRLVEQSRAALDLRDRVATLEAELAAANELADGYRLAVDDSDHRGMGWMAHANALRDALEKANAAFNAWGRDEDGIHPEAWPAVEHLREVLLATPAASLAALKAEVLEPYKAALRVFIDNGDLDTYEESFAAEVRALAAQEVKP